MKKFFKWLSDFFTIKHDCKNCKIQMEVWSRDINGDLIYYKCPKCKYEINGYD